MSKTFVLDTNGQIDMPYTIKSDSRNYVVQMTAYEVPASYEYYCVPKIDTDAFLLGYVTDWEKYKLLEGEVNIYFEDTYIGEDGQEHLVVMVHRTVLGSMERFLATLLEHYGGAFPVWLAPVQVKVIPVADRHIDYAHKLEAQLKSEGIRAEVDARAERINPKIRQAQLEKIPYMLVVGDKEVETDTVSIRLRTGKQIAAQSPDSFKETVKTAIANRVKEVNDTTS